VDKVIAGLQNRILDIDEVLITKNLTPFEREMFLRRKKRLAGEIQRHSQEAFKREFQFEADRMVEKDLPAISGESLTHPRGLGIPNQKGGVKTYGRDAPAVSIRKFHPNITLGTDRGVISPRLLKLRRLMRNRVSKI